MNGTALWSDRRVFDSFPSVVFLSLFLGFALSILVMGRPLAAEDSVEAEVVPGTLLRWPGDGLQGCGMASERWQPLAGACWYPVDLLTKSERLEVIRWRNGDRESRQVSLAAYPYSTQYLKVPESKVNLSTTNVARSRRESAEVAKLWDRRGPRLFSFPLTPPLAKLPASGRFGSRRFFNGQPKSPHSGADYSAATGTPVRSVARGVVALAGDHFFSGKSVFVDHGDGLITMYFHLSALKVEEGQELQPGQILGLAGATGRVTGPHLHFGARWRGARIDPDVLLSLERAPRLE